VARGVIDEKVNACYSRAPRSGALASTRRSGSERRSAARLETTTPSKPHSSFRSFQQQRPVGRHRGPVHRVVRRHHHHHALGDARLERRQVELAQDPPRRRARRRCGARSPSRWPRSGLTVAPTPAIWRASHVSGRDQPRSDANLPRKHSKPRPLSGVRMKVDVGARENVNALGAGLAAERQGQLFRSARRPRSRRVRSGTAGRTRDCPHRIEPADPCGAVGHDKGPEADLGDVVEGPGVTPVSRRTFCSRSSRADKGGFITRNPDGGARHRQPPSSFLD